MLLDRFLTVTSRRNMAALATDAVLLLHLATIAEAALGSSDSARVAGAASRLCLVASVAASVLLVASCGSGSQACAVAQTLGCSSKTTRVNLAILFFIIVWAVVFWIRFHDLSARLLGTRKGTTSVDESFIRGQ